MNSGKVAGYPIDTFSKESLYSLIGSLLELMRWIEQSKHQEKFKAFFRFRFMALILAFENMVPDVAISATKEDLEKYYGHNLDMYVLADAIRKLKAVEARVFGNQ